MEFVGSAYNSATCCKLVSDAKPDILLLDIQLESTEAGILLIPKIKEINPETKIIMLTVHEQDEYIFNALADGAEDFLLKTDADEELLSTIRNITNGDHQLKPDTISRLLKVCTKFRTQQKSLLYIVNTFTRLSATELDILYDLYCGLSYKEVAVKRFVEETTVRAHISRILKKFEYNNMRSLIKALKEIRVFDLLR